MAAPKEDGVQTSSSGEHEIPQILHDSTSDASSETKAEEAPAVGDAASHEQSCPRFGDNQIFDLPDGMPEAEKTGTYDKIELTEDECYDELGYSFPGWKKW